MHFNLVDHTTALTSESFHTAIYKFMTQILFVVNLHTVLDNFSLYLSEDVCGVSSKTINTSRKKERNLAQLCTEMVLGSGRVQTAPQF